MKKLYNREKGGISEITRTLLLLGTHKSRFTEEVKLFLRLYTLNNGCGTRAAGPDVPTTKSE